MIRTVIKNNTPELVDVKASFWRDMAELAHYLLHVALMGHPRVLGLKKGLGRESRWVRLRERTAVLLEREIRHANPRSGADQCLPLGAWVWGQRHLDVFEPHLFDVGSCRSRGRVNVGLSDLGEEFCQPVFVAI